MKRRPPRVRCIVCGDLFHRKRFYETREGPVHDECHEDRIRRGERVKGKSNKIDDENPE